MDTICRQAPGKKGEKPINKEYLALNTRAAGGGGRDVDRESGSLHARSGDINPKTHTHTHRHTHTHTILVGS